MLIAGGINSSRPVISESITMSLIDLGSITGPYFYMAELFLNTYYNVLGTNRLLFSTGHTCLIFPPIPPQHLFFYYLYKRKTIIRQIKKTHPHWLFSFGLPSLYVTLESKYCIHGLLVYSFFFFFGLFLRWILFVSLSHCFVVPISHRIPLFIFIRGRTRTKKEVCFYQQFTQEKFQSFF